MAKLVLRDAVITINGVDFSDHCSSVEIQLKKAGIDTTNFSGGGKEQVAGLKDDEFSVTLQQDFAAAEVDATLYPLYNLETEFTVTVKPTPIRSIRAPVSCLNTSPSQARSATSPIPR